MNPNDPRVDRAIANAFREAGLVSSEYEGSLERLADRIGVAAAPMLAARRDGSSRQFAWWSYPAEWARALIPVSVAVAAASVGFLWLLRTAEAKTPPAPSAIVAAVRPCAATGRSSQPACTQADAVDRAVEELVTTADVPARRSPR
jgi:hypothetical protein